MLFHPTSIDGANSGLLPVMFRCSWSQYNQTKYVLWTAKRTPKLYLYCAYIRYSLYLLCGYNIFSDCDGFWRWGKEKDNWIKDVSKTVQIDIQINFWEAEKWRPPVPRKKWRKKISENFWSWKIAVLKILKTRVFYHFTFKNIDKGIGWT